MSDQPYPTGLKQPVNTEPGQARTGSVRTNPYEQTIVESPVDVFAQDYMEPEHKL